MTIIDAHTHIFPPDVIRDRARYIARDAWFAECYSDPKLLLASEHDLLASMADAGVSMSIACGFPWGDNGLCREHNAWLAEVGQTYAGQIAWMGIVAPSRSDAAATARDALEAGAVAIGELNADAQAFDLTQRADLQAVLDVCRDMQRPAMFHSSEPLGHLYPGKGNAGPDKLYAMVQHFPDQPIVLAHWGGGLPFYELMPEVRAACRNVTYDSAATTYLYESSVFEHVLRLVGTEKILFGSDWPILRQDRLVRRVTNRIAGERELAAVMSTNAQRVFGLEATP